MPEPSTRERAEPVHPERSMTLGDWVTLPSVALAVARYSQTMTRGLDPDTAPEYGITPADLAVYWRPAQDPSHHACGDLVLTLSDIARRWPTLSLRAGIGWACANQGGPFHDLHDLIGRWAEAGLGEDGWRYAAAGLTPAEARAGREAQILDEAQVRTLAALRGAPLPE